jgi:hypothetical protein
VLRAGRDGHWGLPGMRERAEKMEAKLRLWSRAAAGQGDRPRRCRGLRPSVSRIPRKSSR